MKRKTILALITVCILSFASCGKQETTATTEPIVESTQVETIVTEESKVELLPWLQLSSLETHPELRTAFEELVGVTGTTGNKEGILYTNPLTTQADQNITLLLAIKNSQFRGYLVSPDELAKLGEIAAENYTDIDVDDVNAPYATINAYFELLPDQEDGQFDGDSTISRAQAMTLLMRATTPVNEQQAPETDSNFTAKVGETIYTDFAAPMDDYCYISTSNGLNKKSFESTMSRGEYIYMLTKALFGDDYSSQLEEAGKEETDVDSVTFTTLKDGGDVTYQEALNSPDKGLPTDMFNTFKKAVAIGFVTEDNLNWDEAITKSEAINLFIDAVDTAYANSMFVTASEATSEATNSEGLTVDEAAKIDGEYMDNLVADYEGDLFTKYDAYVKDQGADAYVGAWLIYYYGSAAGDQRSYAINQRTGEKMVAGPNSYFYGTSLDDDGATPFYGTDKTYPGDTFPEFEENMTLAIEGKPAHTNGQ